MKTLNKIKMSFAMNAILALIIGLLFIVNPHDSFTIITMICGIYIVVKGMIDLVYYYHSWLEPFFLTSTLLNGIIKCVIGIFILTHISAMTILFSYITCAPKPRKESIVAPMSLEVRLSSMVDGEFARAAQISARCA